MNEWAKWLLDNAHFGYAALVAASGVSQSTIERDMRDAKVNIRAARKAKGLGVARVPEGTPTPAPLRQTCDTTCDTDTDARVAALRDKVKKLEGQNASLLRKAGQGLEDFDEYLAAVNELKLRPLPPIALGAAVAHIKMPKATANLNLADWHTGEVVTPEATGGWGRFDYAILCDRIERLVVAFLSHIETMRHGVQIDELVISVLGDMISGGIHDGLRMTNEWPETKQVVMAADLLAYVIQLLAPHFKTVRVEIIGDGNHARTTVKMPTKNRATSNYDWLVGQMVKRLVAAIPNVTVNVHEDVRPLVEIGPKKFLLSHGSEIKGWSGFPFYGASRMLGREALRRLGVEEKAFDYAVVGHWHQPASVFGGILRVIGSPKGPCEFTNALYPEPITPSQTSWLVGRHGIWDVVDYNLDEE